MSDGKPPFWQRGGLYVSKPELRAELQPLREEVAALQTRVSELHTALQQLRHDRPNAG